MLFICDGGFVQRGFYPMEVLSYGAFVHGVFVLGGGGFVLGGGGGGGCPTLLDLNLLPPFFCGYLEKSLRKNWTKAILNVLHAGTKA